jgi:peptide/nickel transport system substrate-binding protein
VLLHSTDLLGLDQPRAGRQAAAGEGRLQGRHAVDGLADAGRAPRQEGPPAQGGWNVFYTPRGVRSTPNPAGRLPSTLLREGDWFGWPCDAEMEKLRVMWNITKK